MTFKILKNTVQLLLTGDRANIKDDDMWQAAINMAYIEMTNHVTALKLISVDAKDAIRMGPGGTYIRMPSLPSRDEDELDIDNELGPVVARLIASYMSKEKALFHIDMAKKMMIDYENKVQSFINEQKRLSNYENGYYDADEETQ